MTTEMSPPQEPTGVDLARVALRAAREAARKNGASAESKAPRRRTRQPRRSADGRDPKGFGAVLQGLITDRAWELPVAGRGAVDLWPTIAGERLAARVQAVGFRKDRCELVIQADSPAWLTQLRLERPTLLQRFKEKLGPDIVRDIVQAAPGRAAAAHPAPAAEGPAPTALVAPVHTRETASPGYRQARAAHLEAHADSTEKAPQEHLPRPSLREPVEHFTRELARQRPSVAAPSTHARALARARRENAAHD